MMGILGPYSPFLVGGSGLSFRGGVKIASGGRVPSGPFRGGSPPSDPPLCPPMIPYVIFVEESTITEVLTIRPEEFPQI